MRLGALVRRKRALAVLAALLPLSLLGCAATTAEGALRDRVAKERACPSDKLSVTSLGASAYRVEGCGAPETFICLEYYQRWVCTKEGGPQSVERVRTLVDQARSTPVSWHSVSPTAHPGQQPPFLQASPPPTPIPVQSQGGPFR